MSDDEKIIDTPKEDSKEERKARKEQKKEKKSKKTDEETKKELEELEIDLKAGVPLSKKQQRLLKKGKLDLDKLAKKNPAPKPILTKEEEEEEAKTLKKSPYGVWIGNLTFDTTKEDIVNLILAKTENYIPNDESTKDDDLIKVENIDITRINLPKKGNKIKGFAYLDLPSNKHVQTVVAISESNLNGRKLLIKNSTSFEGRPEADKATPNTLSKNPPSRILFVGNLSFDTTEDNLEEHFRHCGDIVRIRMATFEDSGKCKGFAFIDFKDEQGPTTALKSKLAKTLINRPLRLEFGEDRSKRTPNQRRNTEEVVEGEVNDNDRPTQARERPVRSEGFERSERSERPERPERSQAPAPRKRTYNDHNQQSDGKRMKSSIALATAQRASAAIVPSSGKKTTFD